jgi:PIN domain
LVTITERIAACRDPADDKFLELAVNGHADRIVSGDGEWPPANACQEKLAGRPANASVAVSAAMFIGRSQVVEADYPRFDADQAK